MRTIDALEAAVLIMLGSRRYFSSANCRREVEAAWLGSKPLILVHEGDPDKNGMPLDELEAECPADIHDFLFSGRTVLPWHRVYDFQCVTMIGIAEATLLQLPAYAGHSALPLKLPGDVRDQPLEFRRPVVLYFSQANPGASMVALELSSSTARICASFRSPRLIQASETELGSSLDVLKAVEYTDIEPKTFGTTADATYIFLLYLNTHSFSGDGESHQRVASLKAEIRRALASNAPFCLVHENDPAAGGGAFASIISSAGQELVTAGLFGPLATPWDVGDYRAVSIKLALKSLGGEAARSQLGLPRLIRRRSRTQSATDDNDQLLLRSSHGGHAASGGMVLGGSVVELVPSSEMRLHGSHTIGDCEEQARCARV